MDSLIRKLTDILKLSKEIRRFRPADKAYFLLTLADLYQQGFSLSQSIEFMQILLPRYKPLLINVQAGLLQGSTFEETIKGIGFNLSEIAQLMYAEKQGRLGQAFYHLGQRIEQFVADRQEFVKVLTYPLLLVILLIGILFGVRTFMLPQIVSFISPQVYRENMMVQILVVFFTYLPQIALTILTFILFSYLLIDFWLLRLPLLDRYQKLIKVPWLSFWVRSYCAYKFTDNLAFFFEAGFSIQQVIQFILAYPIDPLMTEIARVLDKGYRDGLSLESQIEALLIFPRELPLIILKGQVTSMLSHQCRIYAQRVYKELLEDIRKKISYIQPLLFTLIAVLIVAMYLMMMLPMLTMDGI